jgi:hypothetical protein
MSDQPETLEDALGVVADIIDSEQFSDYVRKGLEAGNELHYKLTVRTVGQGIVVSFGAEKKFPVRNLKTMIRLV